ncbi:V-type proton ATPase subunit H [Neolecta irregularis DAH-3]|uniref:V-type proton ATPase subunit H n=1 Tax=Neolecta irregularis (strain DAH-3) TaxID=1198029 RepID=A0A1U7LSB5_NEOID|nr:V-type proton ATPase subunit H [Neolecta irregularis DAH-3]|eukprot:OLL25566.1 V-type proton ATPase subunit H [Neolecta irregularis DAH-3]
MNMYTFSNPYLEELAANLRARPIPWEGYQRAGLISEVDLKKIKAVDGNNRGRRLQVVQEDGIGYAELTLGLMQKTKRIDIQQYVLVLAGDLISEVDGWVNVLLSLQENNSDLPYSPLLKLLFQDVWLAYLCRHLKSDDESVTLLAAKVLAFVLSADPNPPIDVMRSFLEYAANLNASRDTVHQDLAVQAYSGVLKSDEVRLLFWEIEKCPTNLIVALKKNNGGVQLQYNILLVIWLLSFQPSLAREVNKKYDVVLLLSDILKSAIKEKITRVALAIFRNLIKNAPEENLLAMLVARVLDLTNNLAKRKWSDTEIIEDLQFINEELTCNFEQLTTFDEYTSEVESGHLSWTPPHRNMDFWGQNAVRFAEYDNSLLKQLTNLLKSSNDALVLAVAAHDLGQYLKYVPDGRSVLQNLGAKERIMELMGHPDSDVRYEALSAVQVFMTHAWQE